MDGLLDVCATSAACALGYGATHPLETIKVREMLAPAGVHRSTLALASRIVREEGVPALYAGFSAGLARAVVQGGGRLFFYERCKRALPDRHARSDAGRLLAGTCAGAGAALLGAPIDTVRTVQQSVSRAAGGRGVGSVGGGALDVAARLVREGGVLSLWTGSGAAVARCAVLTAVQCATYDRAKELAAAAAGVRTDDVRAHLAASLLSGVASTTATTPFDNVKTVQMVRRSSALAASRAVWREGGGARGFLRGWWSVYARIAPHTVIMFCSLEWLRAALGAGRRG
ncbi:hypothetical protein KFE25_011123 [Diacronema lutheri]|uniref:Uncharacterized protein n=1 Tax=Diacronema lutheri TaxID=2081491 RepID=A0A8J5XCR0_DIALT|nr:hypothetical protein KFE25_011123 [Diacronema lutheri]